MLRRTHSIWKQKCLYEEFKRRLSWNITNIDPINAHKSIEVFFFSPFFFYKQIFNKLAFNLLRFCDMSLNPISLDEKHIEHALQTIPKPKTVTSFSSNHSSIVYRVNIVDLTSRQVKLNRFISNIFSNIFIYLPTITHRVLALKIKLTKENERYLTEDQFVNIVYKWSAILIHLCSLHREFS